MLGCGGILLLLLGGNSEIPMIRLHIYDVDEVDLDLNRVKGHGGSLPVVHNRGRAIGLDYLIRLQEELHVYIGEQGEPKGLGQPGGGT